MNRRRSQTAESWMDRRIEYLTDAGRRDQIKRERLLEARLNWLRQQRRRTTKLLALLRGLEGR